MTLCTESIYDEHVISFMLGFLIFHVSLCNIHDDRDKINDDVMVLVFIVTKEKDVPRSVLY